MCFVKGKGRAINETAVHTNLFFLIADSKNQLIQRNITNENILQVLGRDILKSSLLDDIDLYLECDDDSLYVMPTVMSPTHSNAPLSDTCMPSSVDELFDIELDGATDFSDCFDPDVAFPVSTFVNCANVDSSSHVESDLPLSLSPYKTDRNSMLLDPHEEHNYMAKSSETLHGKLKSTEEVKQENLTSGKHCMQKEMDKTSTMHCNLGGNKEICVHPTNMHCSGCELDQTETSESAVNTESAPQISYGTDSTDFLFVHEKTLETEVETTYDKDYSTDLNQKAQNINEKYLHKKTETVKIIFSIPNNPLVEDDVKYNCTECKYSCTRETLLKDHRAKVHRVKDLFKCCHCSYIGQLFKHLQKHMLRQHKIHLSSMKPGQEKQKNESKTSAIKTTSATERIKPDEHVHSMHADRLEESELRPIGDEVKLQNELQPIRDNIMAQNKCQPIRDKVEIQSNPQPIEGKAKTQNKPQLIGEKIKIHDSNLRQKLVYLLSKFNGNILILPKWTGTIKLVSILKKNDENSGTGRLLYCDQCEKTFKQKRSLDAHLNVHRGIFPFKCEMCEKKFSCKNLLHQHEKTHSTEKGHHCTATGCKKSFRTNSR